jgi:hypothetical protein
LLSNVCLGTTSKGVLKGSTLFGICLEESMWTIWIEINDLVFNRHFWFVHQMEFIAWYLLVEYVRIDWKCAMSLIDWKYAMFMICRALEIRRLLFYPS